MKVIKKEIKKSVKIKKQSAYRRPSWDEYFIKMVEMVGERGTCDRGRSGAVIVKDKRILATGYVGAPVGLPSCDEIGPAIPAPSLLSMRGLKELWLLEITTRQLKQKEFSNSLKQSW